MAMVRALTIKLAFSLPAIGRAGNDGQHQRSALYKPSSAIIEYTAAVPQPDLACHVNNHFL